MADLPATPAKPTRAGRPGAAGAAACRAPAPAARPGTAPMRRRSP